MITVANYKWQITKSNVSIVVVLLDLILVYTIWLGLLCVRPLEKQVSDAIEQGTLTATDFTVMVKQMPYSDNLL
jgi:hypothetical protein